MINQTLNREVLKYVELFSISRPKTLLYQEAWFPQRIATKNVFVKFIITISSTIDVIE